MTAPPLRLALVAIALSLSLHAQSLPPCGAGTVGSLIGGPFGVLTADGQTGGFHRRVDYALGQPFTLGMAVPPLTGQATADFALFLRVGVPGPGDVTPLPFGIGDMCFLPTDVLLAGASAPFSAPITGLGVPAEVVIQGLVLDVSRAAFPVSVTNGLILGFGTCGSGGPSFVQLNASGSAMTTGHYANAFVATINDPNPKLIGPGHQFTPSELAKIRLAPLATPGTATNDYTWSGGDEVGWFRGRMTVDGSTPGIDRIFFVARNTTNTPNFVDWNGSAFANETTLPAALGSIQRLWVMPDGDLLGNDFNGRVYHWDKQSGYPITPLFQFTNTAGSVPWGSSLDLGLGQPAFDPVTNLILLPIDNEAVSLGGQLYGFDLAGNRVFVDQNLMNGALNGSGSTDFGVTVDLRNPRCRVLAHGGKNGGSLYVARFTGGLAQKFVTPIGGNDNNGGWQGVLIGNEFWTNTNNLSYGAVRRTLPVDW